MKSRSRPHFFLANLFFATLVAATCVTPTRVDSAEANDPRRFEQAFEPEIRPLLQRYCQECHSDKRIEADIDLSPFVSFTHVRKQPQVWQKIGEMLESNQMPPKDARQPSADERKRLQTWVRDYLTFEAKSRAGDPGRVVLRRLNNAEYTYTLRDLTGIESLTPAREFPADGAAGEGFTNTGSALVMSPALVTKYLDAAKEVAQHAVLLPDGFRFSSHTTPRDWTNETLAEIRNLYREHTETTGGDKVNLQGVAFDTNQGGRLPLEKYFSATLNEREALASGKKSIAEVAREQNLNAKYLGILWANLTSSQPSLLMDGLRAKWRAAKTKDAADLVKEVTAWQKGLWKFTTVGHIGKTGGPKAWMEPVVPLAAKHDIRLKIPASNTNADIVLTMFASDLGDGNDQDFVVWQAPRLVAPGRPDISLRDVRSIAQTVANASTSLFTDTAKYLHAAEEAEAAKGPADLDMLSKKYGVGATELRAWLNYLGIGAGDAVELKGHFTTKLQNAANYDFIKGWGSHQTPLLLANSSDRHVRIPGNMRPHSVVVHPSPTLQAAVGWRSPIQGLVKLEGSVTHAHPECGNGVTWSVELRRGAIRQRLTSGLSQRNAPAKFGPFQNFSVQKGDLISILIGPRDGNHSCDLTGLEFQIASESAVDRKWNLASDVAPDVLAGNPHADRFGNEAVWHFYTEPLNSGDNTSPPIPIESLLFKWRNTKDSSEKQKFAVALQNVLVQNTPPAKDTPDFILYQQIRSLSGPLLGGLVLQATKSKPTDAPPNPATKNEVPAEALRWGLRPDLFGKHPLGGARDAANIYVRAPATIEVHLPAALAQGAEFVVTGMLDSETAREGSVQLDVVLGQPTASSLVPSEAKTINAGGAWTANNRSTSLSAPIICNDSSQARQRIEAAFDEYRQLFPAALCYTKIVPVDEVVTLTLFHREDDHLVRLMLDETQQKLLDQHWDRLHYISQDALTQVDALTQLLEYATQDAVPKVFEPLRKPLNDRAAAFRQRLVDTEPVHITKLVEFAAKVFRRPLSRDEASQIRELYASLRKQELPHEEAFRLTLARLFVSPAFLYRVEKPGPGAAQGPVSDFELANRLSYFLWSSPPDDELLQAAHSGRLRDGVGLSEQTRRMLRDSKTRRLATEFACQWLHIYDFDQLDEKSERHFPTFANLRGVMYEESLQFFTDLFQNNGSVLDIVNGDYTFLNEDLAKHYAIPGVKGKAWQRVEGMQQFARGGILAQATTLAKQSGASRTSPILRGNWISEVLLGERLPRPPKGVPQLPDDEAATTGLTVRQLVEKHASDEKCAVCHQRIDPLGFALEGFDAIGRLRVKDLGERPLDVRVKTIDGSQFEGLEGLKNYLAKTRRDAFLRQFCRKLLGYALGRGVQLSDEPLLSEMQAQLKSNDFKMVVAFETIVRSRQFREIRGQDTAFKD